MAYISKWKLKNGTIVPTGSNLFGTCSTASGTATKVVSLSDFDVLVDGVTVHVLFDNKNTAVNASLQVGSTSASPIKYNGNNGGVWEDGALISFTYHGGVWNQNDYQEGGGGTASYGLSFDSDTNELSLIPDGQTQSVTLPNGVTYSLSISGNAVTLNGSDGSTSTVTVPDTDTTYTISISGHDITLTPSSGSPQTITIPDEDTTYTLSINGHTITLTDSDGGTDSVTVPDDNTTYTIGVSGHTLTLTPSSGNAQTVTLPDDDTTYSLSISGDVLTLTGSDGSTDSVTVPDDDTTYTLSINNHSIELVGSDSTTSTVVLPIYALSGDDTQVTLTDSYGNTSSAVYPTYTIYKNYDEIVLARDYGGVQTEIARVTDDNTTYGLQFINGTLTLVASGGLSSVSIPDTNTTYSLSLSGSTLTLTGSDGSTSSVTISGGNIVDVQVDGTSVVDAQGVANIILPEEIFFAEYNVTSFADITSAINDGKAVYAVYSNYIAPLVHTSSGSYVFSMTYDPGGINPQAVRFIVTSADVWSYNLSSLALSSDVGDASNITTGTLDSARLPTLLKVVSQTSSATSLNFNTGKTITMTLTAQSGYDLVGIVGVGSNHAYATSIGGFRVTSSTNRTVSVDITNRNTSASGNFTDLTITVYGLWARSNIY